MKSDRRTLYTKKVIKQSFLTLLNDYPLQELTIKLLCLEADINRATFYRHYQDIYDLYEHIRHEVLEEIMAEQISDVTNVAVLDIMQQNHGFFKECFRTNAFSDEILTSQQLVLELKALSEQTAYDEHQIRQAFYFFIYGIEGLLREWVNSGCQQSPTELSAQLKQITQQYVVLTSLVTS